jgi:hypothetical protein
MAIRPSKRLLLLFLIHLHLDHTVALWRPLGHFEFGLFESKSLREKPWEWPYDPGNLVPVDELEKTATDEEINEAINSVSGLLANANIIRPFKPNRWWLWGRWKGTIIQNALPWTLMNMGVSLALILLLRKYTYVDWAIGELPKPSNPVFARLKVFDKLWQYMMTLTTFTLTFFFNEAYRFWQEFYNIGRAIQGRLNDLSLLLATHAARTEDGGYTHDAQLLLEDVGSYLRTFHILLWASCSRRFRVLLTDRGLKTMVQCGFLTQRAKETLDSLDLPSTQKHLACLEWAVIRFRNGRRDKIVLGGEGLEAVFLEKTCALRGSIGSIGDKVDGRMPLAYAHLVQIMVDTFLCCAPFAQVSGLASTPCRLLYLFGLMSLSLSRVSFLSWEHGR